MDSINTTPGVINLTGTLATGDLAPFPGDKGEWVGNQLHFGANRVEGSYNLLWMINSVLQPCPV